LHSLEEDGAVKIARKIALTDEEWTVLERGFVPRVPGIAYRIRRIAYRAPGTDRN
jgi:hypothetical protein